jgi:two-component sensor histidine kinase
VPTPGSEDQTGRIAAREAAVAELRGRLADSFQLVQSLIRLRLRRTDAPESRADLSWLLDIVTALGLLQQRLASADPGAFAGYLADVGGFWRRIAGDNARIVVEAERFRVAEQRAATLALIAHELIRDAVERAGGEPLSVDLRLRRLDGGRGELLVAEQSAHAGADRDLWLVSGLVEQLGGTLEAAPGRVRFEFVAEASDPGAN